MRQQASKLNFDRILSDLKCSFPDINFSNSGFFSWSPATSTVHYSNEMNQESAWSLIHEVAHAKLQHKGYKSDIELVKIESATWDVAETIAKQYDVAIDKNHIQNCLDTYRDWLYKRSLCPVCDSSGVQDEGNYRCINCTSSWAVTTSKFCRPYRLRIA